MTRSELSSLLESVRNPNWSVFRDPIVSPDLTVLVESWGEFSSESTHDLINAMRLAHWKDRYQLCGDDLPVFRRVEAEVSGAIPLKTRSVR